MFGSSVMVWVEALRERIRIRELVFMICEGESEVVRVLLVLPW